MDEKPFPEAAYNRFLAKLEKREDGHWMWFGSTVSPPPGYDYLGGYGQFWLDGRKEMAHRASYQLFVGPIPDGLDVLHSCEFKLCVNPDHLHTGTHRQNLAEAVAARGGKHWAPRGETHPHAKLTQAQVSEIRGRRAKGESQTALAREFGVSQPSISYIVRSLKWKPE